MHKEHAGLWIKVKEEVAQRIWECRRVFKNKEYIEDYPFFPIRRSDEHI